MMDPAALLAALEWQMAMGADEAMGDAPVDRTLLPDTAARPGSARGAVSPAHVDAAGAPASDGADGVPDPGTAPDLPALAALLQAVPTPLRATAQRFVFADGQAGARVMIVGEAPGRDEDIAGLPFVGRAGQLLDRMLAAIGMSRMATDTGVAVYLANVLPWRPPNNRAPEPDEIALFQPWLERHVTLAAPELLLLMGNTPCQALLGQGSITRIRGKWATVLGRPALPMFHPAYLLRNPAAKREAWADLLTLKARLAGGAG